MPKPDAGYYRLLSQRLEALIDDIERAGTTSDDDLHRRLCMLLAEARSHLAD